MSSLHLVLCRGAIALGLVLAGACGGHVSAALSKDDALRRAGNLSVAIRAARANTRFVMEQAPQRVASRDNAGTRIQKPARLLPMN